METVKTAVVVVVLLGILYGVYVALNKPDVPTSPEAAWHQENAAPPVVELGKPTTGDGLQTLPAGSEATPVPPASRDTLAFDTKRVPQGAVNDLAQPRPSPLPNVQDPTAQPEGAAAWQASANLPTSGPEASLANGDDSQTGGQKSDRSSDYSKPNTLHVSDQTDAVSVRPFDNAWQSALAQLQHQGWTEALLTLSLFYNDPDVTGEERQRLVDLLDPLAGKVFYSTEHALEAPYEVKPRETLDGIAERYQVTATLLQRINGLANPADLQPGTKLKMLRGPFRAEVDLRNSELVLFQGKYYAGRFPISIGNDPAPRPGEYEVIAKQEAREYCASDGTRIPPRASDNPYGNAYLDLGGNMAIHGSPEKFPTHGSLGCISLSPTDAADVHGILAAHSKVLIR